MLLLRIHFGGEVRHGRKGAAYSIGPRFSLTATDESGWYDVKGEIYRQLGYSESEYNLRILARVNVGTTSRGYYEILEIREKAVARLNQQQPWSERVQEILTKRIKKCREMHSMPVGEHEVKVKDEKVVYKERDGNFSYKRETFKYKVINDGNRVACACLKPQLTGIPCAHVLAVCRERRYNHNLFVHPLYSASTLVETWSGQFHGFANQCDWPHYGGPTIVPDKDKIKKGRRKHGRIVMTMDELQGRRLGHQARRSTFDRRAAEASSSRTMGQQARRSTSDIYAAGTSSGYSRR